MPRKGHNSATSRATLLLKDIDIQRWYDNVARGSETTATVYLRRLKAVCERMNTTPQGLVKLDDEARYNTILDFVSAEEKRGVAGSYIQSSVKAIKSWLSFRQKQVVGMIRIKDSHRTPTIEDERVPTQKELNRIFMNARQKDRVSCVLMAHSGVRPEVLGNFRGDDGLRIKDFPDLKIHDLTISFEKIPTRIIVRDSLSKTNRRYFTFLSSEGCNYLKEYLESRLRKGEVMNDNTDIIHPVKANKNFIRTINIGDGIRKAIRTSGFKWRPYVLRAYFDTQLLLAESKGKMTHSYRAFLMGHRGDMEARYTVNKGRLPEELLEDMRGAYERSQGYLQSSGMKKEEDTHKKDFLKDMFRISGMTEAEYEKLNQEKKTNEELIIALQEQFFNIKKPNENTQKVISMKEIEKYIEDGWEYVTELPGNKAIVRRPSRT